MSVMLTIFKERKTQTKQYVSLQLSILVAVQTDKLSKLNLPITAMMLTELP